MKKNKFLVIYRYMNYFYKQLERGQIYELKAQEKIKSLYNVEIIETQTKENHLDILYDFKTSDNISYEVKADFMSEKTHNFFIEYEGYNKPSGIAITRAKMHILISNDNFYLIRTSKIKNLLKTKTYRRVATKETLTKGFLIPENDIIENAIKL